MCWARGTPLPLDSLRRMIRRFRGRRGCLRGLKKVDHLAWYVSEPVTGLPGQTHPPYGLCFQAFPGKQVHHALEAGAEPPNPLLPGKERFPGAPKPGFDRLRPRSDEMSPGAGGTKPRFGGRRLGLGALRPRAGETRPGFREERSWVGLTKTGVWRDETQVWRAKTWVWAVQTRVWWEVSWGWRDRIWGVFRSSRGGCFQSRARFWQAEGWPADTLVPQDGG